MLFLDSFDKAY